MHAPVELTDRLHSTSLAGLKAAVVPGEPRVYSFGVIPDLALQAEALRREFAGQSELLLYHAILMVLLRRRIDLETNLARTRMLWGSEAPFLVAKLDSRWLVSACDTIIDHWHEPEERALALAGTLFANTIKLYETERWATGHAGMKLPFGQPRAERVALHDGMSAFMIGTGDMIGNLHKRMEAVTAASGIAAQIVGELVRRASAHDTIFKRLRDVHSNPHSLW
jgi:hypothetical protein